MAVARERALSADNAARLADTLAAIADPLVVRIVMALGSGGGLSSDELATVLGTAREEVASALVRLEGCGVVSRCAQGSSTDCWHSDSGHGVIVAALPPADV